MSEAEKPRRPFADRFKGPRNIKPMGIDPDSFVAAHEMYLKYNDKSSIKILQAMIEDSGLTPGRALAAMIAGTKYDDLTATEKLSLPADLRRLVEPSERTEGARF